jgi:hypothetical protein
MMKRMRYRRFVVLGIVAALLLVLGAFQRGAAQSSPPSQKQLDLEAAKAQRKAMVGGNMNLTEQEAQSFWPLYNEYEKQMDQIDERHVKMINDYAKNYETLTDDQAKAKLDETLTIAQARLDAQKKYVPKFRAILSQIKATRFFQIDNKTHALVQCAVAQIVPLAGTARDQ